MRKLISQVLGGTLIGLALVAGASATASEGITTQLTDGQGPAISGSNVVWEGWDGSDYEIFFWDGGTITQLTDNSTTDWFPAISGSNVVWQGYDGSDTEIYLWDGATTTQLTNNSEAGAREGPMKLTSAYLNSLACGRN
jgi:beta propeller repeat protein